MVFAAGGDFSAGITTEPLTVVTVAAWPLLAAGGLTDPAGVVVVEVFLTTAPSPKAMAIPSTSEPTTTSHRRRTLDRSPAGAGDATPLVVIAEPSTYSSPPVRIRPKW